MFIYYIWVLEDLFIIVGNTGKQLSDDLTSDFWLDLTRLD